jgi:hypothetical protein
LSKKKKNPCRALLCWQTVYIAPKSFEDNISHGIEELTTNIEAAISKLDDDALC